jgi:hypothetical protein
MLPPPSLTLQHACLLLCTRSTSTSTQSQSTSRFQIFGDKLTRTLFHVLGSRHPTLLLSPPHLAALAAPLTAHSLTTITHVPCSPQAPSLAQDEPTRAGLLLCSLLCSLLPCSPPYSSPGMHAPHHPPPLPPPPLLSQLPPHSTPLFSNFKILY